MPEVLPFTLTDVKPLEAFTDVTELPGATIEFSHHVVAAEGGTRLTHRAQIGGPEWQRYSRMLGENLATGVSRAVAKLAQLAEAESR